jgi:putative peptidoglycan lipid II flippase
VLQQGAHVVERIIASLIDPRAVPAVDYARAISETGLALLAVPLGMAGLAELSRIDAERARHQLRRLLAPLLMVTVPASLFIALHAPGIVNVVFRRGDFGADSAAITSLILTGLAIGFWAHICAIVLIRSLSAHGRNREVARIMALASGLHVVVNIVAWRFAGALALGLAATTFALVLFVLASRAVGVGRAALQTLAPLALGAALYVPIGWRLRADDTVALLISLAAFVLFWLLFLAGWWWLRSVRDRPLREPAFGRSP